jgi:hypothetical protein
MTNGPFTLVKHYLDCITDAGDALILYCADVHFGPAHARLFSVLQSPMGLSAETQSTVGGYSLSASAANIDIHHERLHIHGQWTPAVSAFQQTVYNAPEGSVTWNCLQPGSRVNVRVGARQFAGLGYAECLTLTLPPWRLPLHQLRWGRFVSPQHTLAWIDWSGSHSMRLALCNGIPAQLLSASDSEVVTPDAVLRIEPGISLRSGRLADTILPGTPALARLFPQSLFNISEHKWKSRGTLRIANNESSGWIIHEIVRWPEVN